MSNSVDILKALSARMVSSIANRHREIQQHQAARQAHVARLAEMAPVAVENSSPYQLGTIRPQPVGEPPIVPVRAIQHFPDRVTPRIEKSQPLKEHTPEYRFRDVEAKPYWKR